GRLVPGHANVRMRAREADDERRQRGEEEHGRDEPKPAWRSVDEVRQEREARERARSAAAPPVERDPHKCDQRQDRERSERDRVLEAHRRPPRNAANGRSQSPLVERTTCGTPSADRTRATPLRSSAAAMAKRSRSDALPVSTRTWRPVSGSTSQSSPTSGSSCSRGSRISIARTSCRSSTRNSGARQSSGPRKSETSA